MQCYLPNVSYFPPNSICQALTIFGDNWVDIQNYNSDILYGQSVGKEPSNTRYTSSDNHNLFTPLKHVQSQKEAPLVVI